MANLDSDGGATGRDGATALCMFDYRTLKAWDAAKRPTYLNQFAQVLTLNQYTGQLPDRK